MNQNIKDLLDGIKLTIGQLEEKNEAGTIDSILPKLQEIHKMIGELDLPVNASAEEDIKSDVLALYRVHLSQFISASKLTDTKEIEDKFAISAQFKKFNAIVLATLTKALKENKIKADEYDMIMESFNVVATEEEIKKIVADVPLPMPTDPAGEGNQWVWDVTSSKWIIEKKKV